MLQKRQREDGEAPSETTSSDDQRRRGTASRNEGQEDLIRRVVREELALALDNHLNKFKCVVQDAMETLSIQLSKVVGREEIEHFNCMKRTRGKEVHFPESRSLKLQFRNKVSLPVFTEARIQGEHKSSIKVDLIDALTGQIVNSGPESSAKVEIVVLQGDFDDEEGDKWTLEEFTNNIVKERDGKKPLLTGDSRLTLEEGTGLVGEIKITDITSCTRSGRFRLGAMVVDNSNGIRVREAKTESFIVRDRRGESYKKHYPPSLPDDVWRLKGICKDGPIHKRLSEEKINTVEDFLTLLLREPRRLRHILGKGMSDKKWADTVEHVQTCTGIFLYYPPPSSQQKYGVVFNVVQQLMGLLSECQYVPIDKLSESQKASAQKLVISEFEHGEKVVSFDDEASLESRFSHLNVLHTSSSPRMENSNGSKFLASHNMVGDFNTNSNICDTESMIQAFQNQDPTFCKDALFSN